MPIIGMHIRIGQAVHILVQLFWNGIVKNIGHANDNVKTYIYIYLRGGLTVVWQGHFLLGRV